MRAVAELLADGGAAACGPDFFRSPEFLAAEGATHTLRILLDTAAPDLLAPLVVREIPAAPDLLDAVSPYGYPGIVRASDFDLPIGGETPETRGAAPLDPDDVDFSATGLVSIFLRHTLGEPPLAGATPRNVVQIADPELPPRRRSSDRNRINKNRRAGYEVEIVPGAVAADGLRAGFLAAYEQTMRRAGAGERYFFSREYFDRVLAAAGTELAVVHGPEGDVAAASVAVRSDGFLHYYLSGTADSHLRQSPMKNLVDALAERAAELGLPLNLGGGLAPGDALEEFKRGFANAERRWHVSQIVCDRAAYDRLDAGRAPTDFFPAYRG